MLTNRYCQLNLKQSFDLTKINFVELHADENLLHTLATWAEEAWGYIRNKGVAFRKEVFRNFITDKPLPKCMVCMYENQPIGMFVLLEYHFAQSIQDCVSKNQFKPPLELMYVYVKPSHRQLGVGNILIYKARVMSHALGYQDIVLDTLDPKLNKFYQRHGGQIIGEENLGVFLTKRTTLMKLPTLIEMPPTPKTFLKSLL